MDISIQFVKMPTSDTLNDYTEKKLKKLAEKYEWLIRAEVYFKQGQDKTGNASICEIEVSAPGPRVFASASHKHFEGAAKEALSDLNRQLKKRKATFTAH